MNIPPNKIVTSTEAIQLTKITIRIVLLIYERLRQIKLGHNYLT